MLSLSSYLKQKEQQAEKKEQQQSDFKPFIFTFDAPKTPKDKVEFKGRILPSLKDGVPNYDDIFFLETRKHKGFIENGKPNVNQICPIMFGRDCPICSKIDGKKSIISEIYEHEKDLSEKKIYRAFKANKSVYVNFLVVENPQNSSLEGEILKLYLSESVLMTLIGLHTDLDDPTNILDLKKGHVVKFTVTQNDRGYNAWAVRTLKPLDISDNDKLKDVESFQDRLDDMLTKLPSFGEMQQIVKKALGLDKEQIEEVKEEVKEEVTKDAYESFIENL